MSKPVTQTKPDATKYTRKGFDKQLELWWPKASQVPLRELTPEIRQAMYEAHQELELSVPAICAGFSWSVKKGLL